MGNPSAVKGLIDQHFPKSDPLHKIFNRSTLKLSYSCTSNVTTITFNHNKAEINKSSKSPDKTKFASNCRVKESCRHKLWLTQHHLPSTGHHIILKRNIPRSLWHRILYHDVRTTLALSMNDVKTQLNSANIYGPYERGKLTIYTGRLKCEIIY